MKIQEFGCRDCPIILLIEDSRFPVKNPEKLFHDYFLIVATHEEEQDTEARELIRYISGHYHNPIFVLYSTSGGWQMTHRLLENHLRCQKLFIEADEKEPGFMILPALKEFSAEAPENQLIRKGV